MTRIARHSSRALVITVAVVWFVAAMSCTSAIFCAPALAQDANAGAPGDWLSRYSGARSVGLGSAFVAASPGALGALWNPAGLSTMFQNEVSFETTRLFESTSIQGFSMAAPARRIPSFGLTVLSLSSGDFERTSELNESLGSFDEGDKAFVFTVSQALSPRLSLGGNVKVVQQSIEDFGATGVGADVGLLFDVTPRLRLGASVLNFVKPTLKLRDTAEAFPAEFRGGLALQFFRGRGLISGEIDQRARLGTSLHAGTEMWIHPTMALRVGYDDEAATGGFSYRLASGARFDYGVADHELGVTHRFGVSYRFGGFFANSQAVPPVFSPTGTRTVTRFELESRTKADTQEWRLDIIDKLQQTVRTFGGSGVPPAHVMWDGKDETGLPLADGVYRYVFFVVDAEGNEIIARTRTVEISTSGPQGAVPVIVK